MNAMPPNLLLIHCDQLRFDCLGCHGHPLVRTPNLDRLASEGRDFSLAFTPSPVCSPARACLATGAWATTHRCLAIPSVEHYQPADARLPVLTNLLADAGYVQTHIGKFHRETAATPDRYGVNRYVPESQYHIWRESQGLPRQPRDAGWFGQADLSITADQSRLAWGADQTIEALRHGAASGRPFFVRWDPSEPHLPNCVPEPFASMYDPASIPPWPSFPDPLHGKPFIQSQQRRTWRLDDWSWPQWAPIVARYLGEIALFDAQVGRVLDALDTLEITEKTLVIFTTDHGDFTGGHGMIDKHYAMYDDILRVPLLLRWPGVVPAGQRSDAMVVHELDIARTLLDVAGVRPPESFVGENLIDITAATRADVFAQYHGAQFGLYSSRMLRSPRWKYIWNPTDVDELYNLAADPAELHNLAADADAAEQLKIMRRRLVEWMQSINDPLANQWTTPQLLEGLKP